MRDLVEGARAGDHFVFHCKLTYASETQRNTQTVCRVDSGHGSQVENFDQTEDDGMDEGLRQLYYSFMIVWVLIVKQTTVIWPVDVEYEPPPFEDEPAIVNNYIIDDVRIFPTRIILGS